MSNPIFTITMENGAVMKGELYPESAPQSVYNFIDLANKGFYDGVIFHRVIDNFMIQTGDPLGTGTGGPGYMIKGEFSNNGHKNDLSHTPGVVSMARQGDDKNPAAYYNTAGSQFFICISEATYLDKNYAAFGKVIEGLENAYAIGKVQTDGKDRPLQEQKIAYVRVDTHGATFDEPVTIPE